MYLRPMNYLSVENLSIRFGERSLFEGISFGLNQGQKVAIVGVNGCGKSTLLKLLAGQEAPNNGIFSFRNGIKVAYLSQQPQFREDDTAFDALFFSDHPDLKTLRQYEKLTHKQDLSEADQEQMQQLLIKMDEGNLWDYESQITQILGKLGITDFEQPIGSMSGGQRKKVALARELISRPDFLMLDEPTNHLDIDMIEWLEDYLNSTNATMLMITHDRYFLDKVADSIIEISEGSIFHYPGNYAHYLESKAQRQQQQQVEKERAQNLMRKELEWIRRQPKARGTKAKYRVDAFEGIQEKAKKTFQEDEVELATATRRLGGKILEIKNVSKRFGELQLVENFSYIFKKGERIGIVGNNGSGKTTFLKMLTGTLQPDTGTIKIGQNTLFGYYMQQELEVSQDKKVIEVVQEVADIFLSADGKQLSASQFLNKFLFSPKRQYDYVYKLSGGEKRRLQLLLVLVQNPNFLILDEPTNDLDIVTLNVLEDFLESFPGCLLIVSHDRYFMDRLVDHLFVFEGNGQIKDFNGNYTDLRIHRTEEYARKQQETKVEKEAKKWNKTENRKLSFKEKKEMEKLEMSMEKLEKEKKSLQEKLAGGEGSAEDFATWGKRLSEIENELEETEMRWLELSEIEG